MNPTRKLWQGLAFIFVVSFAVLGWLGREIYLAAPPIAEVKTTEGTVLYTADDIREGQRAWLAAGGQQLGTVWGHGSYVAPDWSADGCTAKSRPIATFAPTPCTTCPMASSPSSRRPL